MILFPAPSGMVDNNDSYYFVGGLNCLAFHVINVFNWRHTAGISPTQRPALVWIERENTLHSLFAT